MTDAVSPGSQPEAGADPQGEAAAPAAAQPQTTQQQANVENDQDRNWRNLRTERDYLRDRVAQLERAQQPARQEQQVEPEQPKGRKTLADFDYDDSLYQDYLFEEAGKRAEQAAAKRLKEQQEAEERTRRTSQFNERQQAFAKENPDYHSAVSNPAFKQSEALLAEIMESAEGPALAMYLANNLDITQRLNQLPAVAVAREVARIEARLLGEREKAKAAQNHIAVGSQPAPAPKLEGGSGSGATVKPDTAESDALSDAEWTRRRNAQIRARANRK